MSDFEIHELDIAKITQADFIRMHEHSSQIRSELLPDDPPISLEEMIQNFKTIPPFIQLRRWHAHKPGNEQIAAIVEALWLLTEENQHLMQFDIEVLPEHRRQGLGKRLLALAREAAHTQNRRLLIANTNSRVPAGAAFLESIGAQRGLEAHTNQLDIDDLDRDLIKSWLAEAPSKAAGYSLGFWDGPYPEEQLEALTALYEVVNDVPMGDMEIEDQHQTPEMLRQMERNIFSSGRKRWTVYVTENSSGKLAGYSEVVWHPNRSHIRGQGMTGVLPEHRNHNLGRWMKAAMLERLLQENPPVRFIRTGNANDNVPMLKINHALGFKPYFANTLWQVPVEKVDQYLAG